MKVLIYPILICRFLKVSCFRWTIMLGHRVHNLLRYPFLYLRGVVLPNSTYYLPTYLSLKVKICASRNFIQCGSILLRCYLSLLSLFKLYIARFTSTSHPIIHSLILLRLSSSFPGKNPTLRPHYSPIY